MALVEQVESFKFLGVHINNQLEWSKHNGYLDYLHCVPPQPLFIRY